MSDAGKIRYSGYTPQPDHRTRIYKSHDNEVTLDPATYLGRPKMIFWVPRYGGYVRHGADHLPSDPYVCGGLQYIGDKLWVLNENQLLVVIKEEWPEYRKRLFEQESA